MNQTLVGFRFHTEAKWKAARAFAVSAFILVATLAMFFSSQEPLSLIEKTKTQPALVFAILLFLFFTVLLGIQLFHILRTPLILEFSEDAIIDSSRLRRRRVPYSLVEIFSPVPEDLFRPDPRIATMRNELGIEEYVSVSCRLRDGRDGDDSEVTSDFVFFEKVETPSFEMQQKILERLRSKISHFDLLIQDDGSGFGDDETNS